MEMETETETETETQPPAQQLQPSPPSTTAAKKKRKQRPSAAATPWTHDETAHLIDAYRDKWHSLRRGQLKSAHWEEVSVTVAARSGHDDPSTSKTALQCRHKMEKLRQRFRSESSRAAPSPWPFFSPMARLLRGPSPISALPATEDDGDNETAAKKPKQDEGEGEGGLVGRVAAEIRAFAGRMAAVEKAKMEAARETERARMEMERKRMDMIMRSQSKIVDSIARVLRH